MGKVEQIKMLSGDICYDNVAVIDNLIMGKEDNAHGEDSRFATGD